MEPSMTGFTSHQAAPTVPPRDLFTAGESPGRLVVDYAAALDAAIAATEARAAEVDREPALTPGADGRLVLGRGRPPKRSRPGTIWLRDLGITKQQAYRFRLLASIPEADLSRWWDAQRRPTLNGALRHFRLVHQPPTHDCPTCGGPLPQRIIRRVLEKLETEHPEWFEETGAP
jgi:hypothetical protein